MNLALDKQKGLSIAAKPFYKLVEAAGLEPASRKPTFILAHCVYCVIY
jgi:hypothetical protein